MAAAYALSNNGENGGVIIMKASISKAYMKAYAVDDDIEMAKKQRAWQSSVAYGVVAIGMVAYRVASL